MTDVNKDISMFLDEKVMKTFCVAKSFKDNDGGRVNSLHFSWNGLSLITSSEDDQIVIYDCERGDQKRLVNSQKYGVDLARFTHGQDSFTARLLDKQFLRRICFTVKTLFSGFHIRICASFLFL